MNKRQNFKTEQKARIGIQAISGRKIAAQLCLEHQIPETPFCATSPAGRIVRLGVENRVSAFF